QLAADCSEAAAEPPKSRLVANYAPPEATARHVEGQGEAEEESAGREPNDGCAVVTADGETSEAPGPAKDVLVLANGRRRRCGKNSSLAANRSDGEDLAAAGTVRHLHEGAIAGVRAGDIVGEGRGHGGHAGEGEGQAREVDAAALG